VPHVLTVNVASLQPSPASTRRPTGITKRPVLGSVEVRAPGSKAEGLGSGLVGDEIGNHRDHGGNSQAVYAYAREELDEWQDMLGRPLASGTFGENLTTSGLVVSDAVLGERWRVGEQVELKVTGRASRVIPSAPTSPSAGGSGRSPSPRSRAPTCPS